MTGPNPATIWDHVPRFTTEHPTACRTYDPSAFHDPTRISEARTVCDGCAAAGDCRAFALAYPVTGVWGGTTERQRVRIRRRRAEDLAEQPEREVSA